MKLAKTIIVFQVFILIIGLFMIPRPTMAMFACSANDQCLGMGRDPNEFCNLLTTRSVCESNQCCQWFNLPAALITASTTSQNTSTVESSTATADLVFNPQVPGFIARYVFRDNSTRPIADTIKTIFEYGIKVVGLMALIAIMVGGFIWLSAGGNSQKVTEAKQWISSSLVGLLLLLFSYTILNTINPNLVNLKLSTIKKLDRINIAYENKTDPRQFNEDNAQKTMTIASSTDPAGRVACCVINTPQIHGNSLVGVQTLNCATYQATFYKGAGANSIEALCRQFYQNHAGLELVGDLPFTSASEAKRIGARSAAMFAGNCEDSEIFRETCMGKNHEDYCQSRNVGSSCITNDNYWGYCNRQKECTKCAGYGQTAEHSYQCPTYIGILDNNNNVRPLKNLSNSPQVLGDQCGNDVAGCLSMSRSHQQCLCFGSFCYQECLNNGGYRGSWISQAVCLNIEPNKRHLYVGINSAQPTCRR